MDHQDKRGAVIMNIVIIIIEMIVFAALFTAGVFTAAKRGNKNSEANIHNYPPDIQEEYFNQLFLKI